MPGMQDGCPMCGTMQRDQTDVPSDTAEIRRQIDHLQRRLGEIEGGQTSPQQMQGQMPMMCPMCQGMTLAPARSAGVGGMSAALSQDDVVQRLEDRIRRLEERIDAP